MVSGIPGKKVEIAGTKVIDKIAPVGWKVRFYECGYPKSKEY